MSRLSLFTGIALLTMLAACGTGGNGSTGTGEPIIADSPWLRAGNAGGVSGGYVVLENPGDVDVEIVGARSEAAEAIELHETSHEDGMMRMRRVERVAVPAAGRREFAPGGLHFMLVGLREPLTEGQQIPVLLSLDSGAEVVISFEVRKIDSN